MGSPSRMDVVAAEIAGQVTAHAERGPSWPLQPLRSCSPRFVAAGEEARQRIAQDPLVVERVGEVVRDRAADELDICLHLRSRAMDALDDAVVTYEGAPAGTRVYCVEARLHSVSTGEESARLRTALTDSLTDGSDMAREIRTRCGVGEPLNREAPLEVHDLAERQLRYLGAPVTNAQSTPEELAEAQEVQARRAYLEANGILVDAYLNPIRKKLAALDAALKKVPQDRRAQARQSLDLAQLRVELISMRIVSLVNAGLGVKARDEIRDILPRAVSSYSQRRQDRETVPAPAPATDPLAATVPVAPSPATVDANKGATK